VSEFGIEKARELAAESHRTAREALAQAAVADTPPFDPAATSELEQITDFIYTRTS
jgi:geranylgeranyl diphosphate synthase, type II